MKFRWFILFFLVGLTCAAILYIASPSHLTYTSSPTDSAASPAPPPDEDPSETSTQEPIDELVLPPAKQPLDPAEAAETALNTAEGAINAALNKLPEGELYHNVPEEMQVGVAETIEAGIAPEVTEQIKKELQGRGDIKIESNISFDPSGMEMRLIVAEDEFEVDKLSEDKQFVTASTPGKWLWRVTPLKAGDNLIIVKAIVDLKVPELGVSRPVEVEVFSATRQVKVNWAYAASHFVAANWKEVLGLVIGSGSLVSVITWWVGNREKKKTETTPRS